MTGCSAKARQRNESIETVRRTSCNFCERRISTLVCCQINDDVSILDIYIDDGVVIMPKLF